MEKGHSAIGVVTLLPEKMLQGGLTTEQQKQLVNDFDLIYFSGISMAILDAESRQRLLKLLSTARKQGARIVFDGNYRPVLWESEAVAREVANQCLMVSDMALMTFDDEQMLHKDVTPEETLARLKATGCKEVVVKNGSQGLPDS